MFGGLRWFGELRRCVSWCSDQLEKWRELRKAVYYQMLQLLEGRIEKASLLCLYVYALLLRQLFWSSRYRIRGPVTADARTQIQSIRPRNQIQIPIQ